MPNTSATGGYLQPTSTAGELDDNALEDFLHDVVVGITALPNDLVRPRWQPQPPVVPQMETDWCAIGLVNLHPQFSADIVHNPNDNGGDGSDTVFAGQMELAIKATFYGPNKFANAMKFWMGLQIPQNREQMQLNGYGLISCDEPGMGADLLNEVEVQTAEVPFGLRRSQAFTYPILNLEGAQLQIALDGPPTIELEVDVDHP